MIPPVGYGRKALFIGSFRFAPLPSLAAEQVAQKRRKELVLCAFRRRLPFLVKLSRSTRAVINQNFLFGVMFIVLGLTAAATGYLKNPIIAAILHNVGSLIVIFNSARLVRKGEELEHYQPETAAEPGPGGGAPTPASAPLAPSAA